MVDLNKQWLRTTKTKNTKEKQTTIHKYIQINTITNQQQTQETHKSNKSAETHRTTIKNKQNE